MFESHYQTAINSNVFRFSSLNQMLTCCKWHFRDVTITSSPVSVLVVVEYFEFLGFQHYRDDAYQKLFLTYIKIC